MLQVVLENILVGAVAVALLLYLGVGLSAWLPAVLLPYRLLLAPWAGYCLLVIVTQFLSNSPLALTARQAAFVALGFSTVANAYALWRGRRANDGKDRLSTPDSRPLILLALATFALCLLPIWSYGYNTVIGENWDAEIYLGLGEYLKSYAQIGLGTALPNPILDTLINPPYGLRTHGFSYLQAGLGFLPLDSLHTLAPLLAALRALSIPVAYVFFREGLSLRNRPALWACAALGLNAFLLWVTYNTFGMQVPTFGLLPFASCLFVVTIRAAAQPGSRVRSIVAPAVWTGFALAGIAVTYHPALTAFAALAGLPVLVLLVTMRASWVRLLASVGITGVSALLLSLVSQLKSLEGFLKQYSEKTGGLGLTGFTSPADAYGFSLSFRNLIPADAGRALLSLASRLYGLAGWLALAMALLLVGVYLYGLWRTKADEGKPIAWARMALVLGAVVYVLLFLRPLDYPYGWFKALSFVSFVLIGAAVGGLWSLMDRPMAARFGGATRKVAYALGAGGLALVLLTTLLTVARYWGEPLRYSEAMLEASAVQGVVAGTQGQDGSVYVGSSPNMRQLGRLYNGILSYFLRDTDLYGTYDTANSKLDREKPSGVYRYTLLHADDDPAEFGVMGAQLAWHNSLLSLYALPPEDERTEIYHHDFRGDSSYPAVSDSGPTRFTLSTDSFAAAKVDSRQATMVLPEKRQFSLGLAAFTTATLGLNIPDGSVQGREMQVVVPPGYSIYRSPAITTTGTVSISHAQRDQSEQGSSVNVRWAHLDRYTGEAGQEEGLSSGGPGLLLSAGAAEFPPGILARVLYLNNRPGEVSQTLSLDIYGVGGGNTTHYGYWNINVPGGRSVNMGLSLDPARKTLTLDGGGGATLADAFKGDTSDGTYTASLLIYENGQVSEAFNDIFRFEIKAGKLSSFKPRNLPPLFR